MAKVSILIPVYNQENYLEKCMETVRRQTLPDIEIICVNDGSTDRSLAMLKEYAAQDARIVLLDGPNGGYGKAMNRALDAAGGEYIGIVEPDDYVPLSQPRSSYHACVSDKELFLVEGAGHVGAHRADPEKYEKHVNIFFERFDS